METDKEQKVYFYVPITTDNVANSEFPLSETNNGITNETFNSSGVIIGKSLETISKFFKTS